MKDHLGNVRAVLTDVRQWADNNSNNTVDATESVTDVRSWSDPYVFGSEMPGRTLRPTDYRYGMNGQEKDDEIYGSSGSAYGYFGVVDHPFPVQIDQSKLSAV